MSLRRRCSRSPEDVLRSRDLLRLVTAMYAACRDPYGSSIHRATQSWLSSDDGCCWWRRLLPKRPLERTTATAASPIHFPRRFTQPAAKLRGVSVFTGASRFPNRSVRPRERIGRRRCRLRHRFRGSTSHGFKPKHGRHHFPSGENDRRLGGNPQAVVSRFEDRPNSSSGRQEIRMAVEYRACTDTPARTATTRG